MKIKHALDSISAQKPLAEQKYIKSNTGNFIGPVCVLEMNIFTL